MSIEKRSFKKRFNTLKAEQKEAFNEMQKDNRLTLCYPCGFGKGYLISTDILGRIANSKTKKIFGLLSHRLALNSQHMNDIFDAMKPLIGKVAFAFVGSEGGLNTEKLLSEQALNKAIFRYNLTQSRRADYANLANLSITTINKRELDNFILNNQDKTIIIVSTYHSGNLLRNIDFDTIYCDEAHELASNFKETHSEKDQRESFYKNFTLLSSTRNYFLTATPKDCSDDPRKTALMNNTEIFGRRIGMSHKEAVEKGYVLGINLTVCYPEEYVAEFNNSFTSIANKAFFILCAFEKNREYLLEHSARPDKISPKLLVRCSSVGKDMWQIYEQLKKLVVDIKIFACASKDGGGKSMNSNQIYLNGKKLNFKNGEFKVEESFLNRKDYIQAIQSLPDTEPAIILHHDTLSEGINVPGITAFLPFTDSLINFGKLLQNIGRAIRLNRTDAKNFTKNKIAVDDNNWIKPCAQIFIPFWSSTSKEAMEMIVRVIVDLERNYGAKTSTDIPNTDDSVTGNKNSREKTTRKNIDTKKQNLTNILFTETYNKALDAQRDKEMLEATKGMGQEQKLDYIYNII